MAFIEKELLIGRVYYLKKINSKPGMPPVNDWVVNKVIDLIKEGKLETFMQVEAVFTHLLEYANDKPQFVEESAQDILDFLA